MKKRLLTTPAIVERELKRLPSSIKAQIQAPRELSIWGDILGKEIQVTYLLTSKDESIHYCQEVGCNIEELSLTEPDGLAFLLSSSRTWFVEFLEDGELNRLPLEWSAKEKEGRTLKVRASLTRPALDRIANELLGLEVN